MTTKPSERIVVFVTPAQKLAISNTAESLGISASELMRRAVMSFDATSEQVKVAGIVDRLHAPRAPDPLNVALQQVAERAAAREARDAAQTAKAASKRSMAEKELPAQKLTSVDQEPAAPALAADGSANAAESAAPGESQTTGTHVGSAAPAQATPVSPDQTLATTRAAAATPTADANALAKPPQAISIKTSISLHPFNVARFVKS
jgi:hypothetical protein